MDDDQLRIPRSMSKLPGHASGEMNKKDGLQHEVQQMHPRPQGYTYHERDSIPRSLALQDYIRSIERETRIYSDTTIHNHDFSKDNYVLEFGTSVYDSTRVNAEPINSRLAALLLDDDDTEVAHLVFDGLPCEDTCAQKPRDANSTKEQNAVPNADKNEAVGLDEGRKHTCVDIPRNNLAHRNFQATIPETSQSAIDIARKLSVEDTNICDKFISTSTRLCSWEPGNKTADSSTFSDNISGSSSFLLQIGSWAFVTRPIDSQDEVFDGDVPLVTLAETGGYPKQLKYEFLGANQCAGDAVDQSSAPESSQRFERSSTNTKDALPLGRVDKGKRRISGRTNEDEDEEHSEDELGNAKRKKIDYDFACPFYKHQSQISRADDGNRYKYRVCATTKFANITRLKEHLYRVHKNPIRCPRCQKIFKHQGQLDNHLKEEVRCENRTSEPVRSVCMTAAEEAQVRKKTRVPDQVQKWREIYLIFFPGDSIPSPYHHDPASDTSPIPQQGAEFSTFLESRMPQILETELEDLMDLFGLDADQRMRLVSSVVTKASSCHMTLWGLFHKPHPVGSPQTSEATVSLQNDSDPIVSPDIGLEAAIQGFFVDLNGQQTNGLKGTTAPTIYGNCFASAPPIQSQLPPSPNSTGSVKLFPTTYYMPLPAWNSDSGRGTLPSCDHGSCIDCQHRKSMDLMMSPTSIPDFLASQPFLLPSAEPNQGGEPISWVPGHFDHHPIGENQIPINFEGTRNSQYQDTQDENSHSQHWPNWQ